MLSNMINDWIGQISQAQLKFKIKLRHLHVMHVNNMQDLFKSFLSTETVLFPERPTMHCS